MENTTTPETKRLWTANETAAYLQVCRRHLENLRDLPRFYLGGAVRFDPDEVMAYMKANRRLQVHKARKEANTRAKNAFRKSEVAAQP